MTPQLEIAVAAFFLAIGTAGPPLELPRMLLVFVLSLVVWASGRFVGAVAMGTTIIGAWWQHGQFRMTTLVAATLLGVCAHLLYRRPRASTAIMGIGAVAGVALLFLG